MRDIEAISAVNAHVANRRRWFWLKQRLQRLRALLPRWHFGDMS